MQVEQTEPATTEDQHTEATIVSTSDARETPGNRPKRNRGIVNYGPARRSRTSHPIERKRQQSNELQSVPEAKKEYFEQQWHIQYERLVDFKRKNGHCQVPGRYEQDISLGNWVNRQRKVQPQKKMKQNRKDLLDEIEFVWKVEVADNKNTNVDDLKWDQQYERLVEFQRNNGHSIVPKRYKPDKVLANWVACQRAFHHKHTMRQHRKERLDAVGFVWNVQDHEWHSHYDNLMEFQRENGHCIVPSHYKHITGQGLGHWLATQRTTTFQMPPERKELFAKLDFVWNSEHHKWSLQYQKMVQFQRTNGHCLVPTEYEQDPPLATWVHTQRRHHTDNEIPIIRKNLLDTLGFVWNVPNNLTASSYTTEDDLDLEAVTSISVSLPNKAPEETKKAQGHVRKRLKCPSIANKKRQRMCYAESGPIMPASSSRTINQRGNATDSHSSAVEKYYCHSEENPNPPRVTSNVRISSDSDSEIAQGEATTPDDAYLPPGWVPIKLEPDW